MGYRIAVVGATGNVGHEMLNILAERAFPRLPLNPRTTTNFSELPEREAGGFKL